MNATLRRILIAAVFLLILWAIWSRTYIVVFGHFTDLLWMLGLMVVAFLLVDHYFNREKR